MRALALLLLAACGCRAPLDPGPLAWLLEAEPDSLRLGALAVHADSLQANLGRHHQYNGIVYKALWRDTTAAAPSHFGDGGDSALFTGFQLGAACFRYALRGLPEDRAEVAALVRGLHILTSISGTPGVLVRCAFPPEDGARWSWPDHWTYRAPYVYVGPDDVPDPLRGGCYPAMVFYARTTRDQLTGVLFGLSVAWCLLEGDPETAKLRALVGDIATALHGRIVAEGDVLRDHEGRAGTSADGVRGLLRALLYGLRARVAAERGEAGFAEAYARAFDAAFPLGSRGGFGAMFYAFTNLDDYYAWNLRFSRTYALALLDTEPSRRALLLAHCREALFPYVRSHGNSYLLAAYAGIAREVDGQGPDAARIAEALSGLKSLALRPLRSFPSPLHGQLRQPPLFSLMAGGGADYVLPVHLRKPTAHFVWQKSPFDPGDGPRDLDGLVEATGVDFLLPYWMGRYYGLWEAE